MGPGGGLELLLLLLLPLHSLEVVHCTLHGGEVKSPPGSITPTQPDPPPPLLFSPCTPAPRRLALDMGEPFHPPALTPYAPLPPLVQSGPRPAWRWRWTVPSTTPPTPPSPWAIPSRAAACCAAAAGASSASPSSSGECPSPAAPPPPLLLLFARTHAHTFCSVEAPNLHCGWVKCFDPYIHQPSIQR